MCGYCDMNILDALAINEKDEAVIINQYTDTKEFFIDNLETEIYIKYCPMCGRRLSNDKRRENKKIKEVFNEYINALIESRKNIKVILEEEKFLFDSKENYEKAYDNYVYATALLREIENKILKKESD